MRAYVYQPRPPHAILYRMTAIIGIRHGEVHNPEGVIYAGLPGYGLSEYGRAQARAAADALRDADVVALYASPLDRAGETAAAISEATGVPVSVDDRLQEWRFWSGWAGMTWDELRERALDRWNAYQDDPGSVTEGESLAELAERMGGWMRDVRAAHPEGLVVGISHLEPLRAVLLALRGRPYKELFDIRIGLGEAVVLDPDPDPAALTPEALRERIAALRQAQSGTPGT